MFVEMPPEERDQVREIFHHYPYVHGSVAAAVEGGMGTVYADKQISPSVALATVDFRFLAGDARSETARSMMTLLKPGDCIIAPTPEWQKLLDCYFPEKTQHPREAFSPGTFNIDKLKSFVSSQVGEFRLQRVQPVEVRQFAEDLSSKLVCNFRSFEDFSARGCGFGILHGGKFVAGASSTAIGGGKLEIEIQTHPDYRRRGLAKAVGAELMLHCFKEGLEPCWDAANPASAALARELGFIAAGKYSAYTLR
jgi:GNAT superfamily N-acetyltransferase